ncbi:MAG TPA: hypothetical protein VMT99_01005, partial [Candidatus Paceibacterota bacterium]|nr:hypothetical protein [Candidatus Paceibacterota bacterium]
TATSSAGTDCTYFGLGGGGYHCAASSSVYNIDGTGWVPVDFTKIGAGSSIQKLPIDPVNNATSGEFYAYATDGATSQLEAVLASNAAANSGVNNGQNTTPVFLYGDSNVDLPIVITSQQSSQTGFQPPSGYHNQLVITATAACGQSPFRCITSGSNGWELWWGTSVNTFAVIVHNTTLISTTTNYSGCGIGSCNYTGLDNSSNPFNLVYNNHTWYTHGCSGGRDYHCFSTAHASGTWTFSYSSASLNL